MYISLVVLKTTDSYEQHQAIWSLFPNTPDRKRDHLFRIESNNKGQIVALLQSSSKPSSSEQAEVLQNKPFDLKLNSGQYYKFKLVANPTKRLSKQRNVIEIKEEAEQIQWLQRKLEGANVTVTAVESTLVNSQKSFKSRFVTFEGILQITDADNIYRAVVMGIGRNKHAGAGLLSLAITR
jgi:CRISPR system Cascade subunit CasE